MREVPVEAFRRAREIYTIYVNVVGISVVRALEFDKYYSSAEISLLTKLPLDNMRDWLTKAKKAGVIEKVGKTWILNRDMYERTVNSAARLL